MFFIFLAEQKSYFNYFLVKSVNWYFFTVSNPIIFLRYYVYVFGRDSFTAAIAVLVFQLSNEFTTELAGDNQLIICIKFN